MKEKKVIDYTRTYRRIEIDKKKCILYIVILILLGFLLMWTQIDDLTRVICKIGADALKNMNRRCMLGSVQKRILCLEKSAISVQEPYIREYR